jgi:hypothetical protein
MKKLLVQGDVALRRIENMPINLTEDRKGVVALGEISGHAHKVSGKAQLFKDSEGRMFVTVGDEGATLDHVKLDTLTKADHDPLTLKKGCYEVILQNEYNPYSEAWERVLD